MTKLPKLQSIIQPDVDGKPRYGVGPGVGKAFAEAYFPEAQSKLRIASAFFTPSGYKVGKAYIGQSVIIHILVRKEQGHEAQAAIVEEIIADLNGCTTDLWDTVFEIVQRLKQRTCIIQEAREMQVLFHCKFYISDAAVMWQGSANYTYPGLCSSAEQVAVSSDTNEITDFLTWYDSVAQDARDLFPELIDILEQWLNLATPFEVYLKILLSLDNVPEYTVRQGAYLPTYYQKAIISRALQQIDKYGGAFVVAATGLGKTVIGAEVAMRLQKNSKIKRTILFLPNGVFVDWRRECKGRDVTYERFSINILFRRASDKPTHQVAQLHEFLQYVDSETLIVIDEVHFLRNEQLREHTKDKASLVYQRLLPAVKAGAKMVLLTATAYGTTYHNLNSLLRFLPWPHKDLIDDPAPWSVQSTDAFAQLPIVSILGLPHVLKMAHDRGDLDEDGRTFIQFPNMRKYLPKSIILHKVHYQLPLHSELLHIFDAYCFDQEGKFVHTYYSDDDTTPRTGASDTIYNASLGSWLSSPLSLAYSIEQNIGTPGKSDNNNNQSTLFTDEQFGDTKSEDQSYYASDNQQRRHKVLMCLKRSKRASVLTPILSKLKQSRGSDDDKLLQLKKIITEQHVERRDKIIIFVNRHLTALYLVDQFSKAFGNAVNVACTVEMGKIKPQLKKAAHRFMLLRDFSPISHNHKTDRQYDVLICTDADGIGVNLQDACTLVNYDPPKSADVLFQRVGRILRMTDDKNRTVTVYTFAPSIVDSPRSSSRTHSTICKEFKRMARRHDNSKSILGSIVMSDEQRVEIHLDKHIDVEQIERDKKLFDELGDLPASPGLNHTSILEQYRAKAEQLPKWTIVSAKHYKQRKQRIVVLIKHKDDYHLIVFDIKESKLEEINTIDVLDMIACVESEDKAMVKPKTIEHYANQVAEAWCRQKIVPLEEVSKICALYLLPTSTATQITDLLTPDKEDKKRR